MRRHLRTQTLQWKILWYQFSFSRDGIDKTLLLVVVAAVVVGSNRRTCFGILCREYPPWTIVDSGAIDRRNNLIRCRIRNRGGNPDTTTKTTSAVSRL